MDYLEHDLFSVIAMKVQFSLPQIKCLMQQVVDAVVYLHDRNVVHRDVKCTATITIQLNKRVWKCCVLPYASVCVGVRVLELGVWCIVQVHKWNTLRLEGEDS